jgi:hypothetical protein
MPAERHLQHEPARARRAERQPGHAVFEDQRTISRPRRAQPHRREVGGVGPQRLQAALEDLVGGVERGQHLAQPAQGAQPPPVDHLTGGLRGDVHHAFDDAARTADGRVGEREVGLLEAAAAHERHGLVLDVVRAPAGQHGLHHRADRVPGLREDLAGRGAERRGVLVGDQRDVGLVVDEDELRPPQQRHGELGVQREIDGVAQRRGPRGDRPERRGLPVNFLVRASQSTGALEEDLGGHTGQGSERSPRRYPLIPIAIPRILRRKELT